MKRIEDQGARNAELRDEVARLSGLAAAIDEYEHAPHGGFTVRRVLSGRDRIPPAVRNARQPYRNERLAA
jgi:hypothetical protein